MDECIGAWMNGWIGINGCMGERIDYWIDGHKDEWMSEWMN